MSTLTSGASFVMVALRPNGMGTALPAVPAACAIAPPETSTRRQLGWHGVSEASSLFSWAVPAAGDATGATRTLRTILSFLSFRPPPGGEFVREPLGVVVGPGNSLSSFSRRASANAIRVSLFHRGNRAAQIQDLRVAASQMRA